MSDLQVTPAMPKVYDPSQEAPLACEIVPEDMEVLYYAGCPHKMKMKFEFMLRTKGYDYVIKRIAGDSTAHTSDPYLASLFAPYMNNEISHVMSPVKVYTPEQMAAAVKEHAYQTCLNSLTSFKTDTSFNP